MGGRTRAGIIRTLVVAGALSSLLVACSGDDDDTFATPAPQEDAAATTTTAADSSPSDTEPPDNADDTNPDLAVAEANGWRLAVTQPTAGMTISPSTTLCVEISGPTREPEVALEVVLHDASGESESVDVEAEVGSSAVPVELPETSGGFYPYAKYDLDVQLIADGEPVDSAVAYLVGVNISEEPHEVTCE